MKAVTCPVCTGSGIVDEGFYQRTSDTWTNSGGTETCRACNGKGWVEVRDEDIHITSIDVEELRKFMREEGLPEIIEALKLGIMKTELKEATE